VHQVIGQAHTILHQQGIVRIQTDIRVGSRSVLPCPALPCHPESFQFFVKALTYEVSCDFGDFWRQSGLIEILLHRTDKVQSFEDKVNKVRELLAQ
jgi:hypothetical protein